MIQNQLSTMKKTVTLIIVFFVFFESLGQGYSSTTIDRIDKVLDRKTGKILKDNQLNEIIEKHRNIVFDYTISKYGEKENYSIHSDSIKTGRFDSRANFPLLKKGDKVHEFVFKTTEGKNYESSNLKDSYLLIRFEIVPKGIIFNKDRFLALDKSATLVTDSNKLAAFACFIEEENENFKTLKTETIKLVAAAGAFHEKFGIKSTPTTLLFNKNGELILSFSDADNVDLSKLIK